MIGRILALVSLLRWAEAAGEAGEPFRLDITMNGYRPAKADDYVCINVDIPRSGYVVGYRPTAHADRVHHMLLFGCSEPAGPRGKVSECLHGGICRSPQKILFAWARNAPAFQLPKDVGFAIGELAGFTHLVLQVHYANPLVGAVGDYSGVTLDVSPTPPPFSAAVFLFIGMVSPIPAHQDTFYMNMSCTYRSATPFTPFAFRTHTHGLGRLVSAARRPVDSPEWDIIGKRNPQWPQLFQKIPPSEYLKIEKNDLMAAQCRFNSTRRSRETMIGATGEDEMCNFYMMHFWASDQPPPFRDGGMCGMDMEGAFEGPNHYPEKASQLLPKSPMDEEHAKQSASFGWAARRKRWGEARGLDESEGRLGESLPTRTFSLHHPRPKSPYNSAKTAPGVARRVTEDGKWSRLGNVELGQVAGLAMAPAERLLVFHRGEVVWGPATYDFDNRLRERNPVKTDAVVEVECGSMKVVRSWGAGKFYMPHGIAVDSNGKVWTTDVGSHQVQRWSRSGVLERSWGVAFEPGAGPSHFCKPAGVAVAKDGSFYVADGYCNNRIVHFAADGSFKAEFGTRSGEMEPGLGTFLLPHDVTLHEAMGELHVADRQNARVQILRSNGTSLRALSALSPPDQFRSVYATDVCAHDGMVFLLPGENPTDGTEIRAFAASKETQRVAYDFAPSSQPFRRPHILRASLDCQHVFVGEIEGGKGLLWRFAIQRDSPSLAQPHVHANDEPPAPIDVPAKRPSQTKPETGSSSSGSAEATVKGGRGLGVWGTLLVVGLAGLLGLATLWVCCRCRTSGSKRRAMTLESVGGGLFDNRSHKGFQRLRTEDVDAMDDVTDESDDDHLYSRPPQKPQ